MKNSKAQEVKGRRGFLRQAGQSGLLAGAAVLGARSANGPADEIASATSKDDKRGYHETEHIRQYYRTSGLF